MSDLYKPGTDNLPAGEYREVEKDGSYIENGRIVNINSGDRLPPTGKKVRRWIKEDC